MNWHLTRAAIIWLTILLAACGSADARHGEERTQPVSGGAVDTMHPPAVLLERFRERLAPPPGMQLTGGTSDRDALVDAFMRAASRADTVALRDMHMNRSEFAWIYFPGSPYASAPYELPPDYVWFHTMAESNKGGQRAIRALSEGPVTYHGYRCDDEPQRYGEALLWVGCRTQWADAQGKEWDFRLFGSILEHGGRFKFVSFANRL